MLDAAEWRAFLRRFIFLLLYHIILIVFNSTFYRFIDSLDVNFVSSEIKNRKSLEYSLNLNNNLLTRIMIIYILAIKL